MYEKTTLPNGLRIVTDSMPAIKSVAIVFYVGTGSRYEAPAQAGISHFLEHLLFKGSRRYPKARDISEKIEGIGGIMNAATDREVTSYWCKVASSHFLTALDVLGDMLRYPLLEPEEIERERLVIVEELRMTNDDPSARAEALLDELLWPNQALGRDIGGTEESVMALAPHSFGEYMAHQYSPQNIVVSVAGDISHRDVVKAIDYLLGDWIPSETLDWYPELDVQTGPHLHVEGRKTDQAHLFLAVKGVSTTSLDRYPLDLLSTILGEGMSSRLFLELRERQALVYDVHSFPTHLRDCGALSIYAGVDPRRATTALETILEELQRVKEEVPQEEIRKVKELAKGRLLLRMEDSRSVAGWMGAQEIMHGQVRTVDEVLADVELVSPEQIARVANQIFVTDKLNLAVVGPRRAEGPFRKLLSL